MKEHTGRNRDQFIEEERRKIGFLQKITDKPKVFLFAQNALLYDRDLSHLKQKKSINEIGLPTTTDKFYQRKENASPVKTEKIPRVLNIGSGGEATRKLPAINVDISIDGTKRFKG